MMMMIVVTLTFVNKPSWVLALGVVMDSDARVSCLSCSRFEHRLVITSRIQNLM